MENNKNLKLCKVCEKEIAKNAKVCPHCGAKIKKAFYKKPWFIVLAIIVVIAAISSGGKDENKVTDVKVTNVEEKTIEYTKYDVSELVYDLKNNALKAEKKYNNQYVEITGKLSNIDSDGSYISLDPSNSQFNFVNVQCFTKNKEQIDKIAEMSKGDIVTLKGKVTSVGEVLGYSVKIDEIN